MICGSVTSLSPFIIVEPVVVRTITAAVDVSPNVLNASSNGSYITVYVEFPGGDANPADLDVSSVRLSTESGEIGVAAGSATNVGDGNGDGVVDLMVKFDRAIVQSWLAGIKQATLRVSGRLADGTPFQGEDVIRVIAR